MPSPAKRVHNSGTVIQARGNRRFYWILAGLVSLNNFLFLHFGLLFLGHMKSAASYAGIVPLAIAAANAAILRLTHRHSGQLPHLQNLLLGLTALFLTLAAPIQFRAETTTLCWAAETVVALGPRQYPIEAAVAAGLNDREYGRGKK